MFINNTIDKINEHILTGCCHNSAQIISCEIDTLNAFSSSLNDADFSFIQDQIINVIKQSISNINRKSALKNKTNYIQPLSYFVE